MTWFNVDNQKRHGLGIEIEGEVVYLTKLHTYIYIYRLLLELGGR